MESLVLEGSVEAIIFKSEDTGYTVAKITANKELITIVGVMPLLQEGQQIEVKGTFIQHKQFGRQFSIEEYKEKLPSSSKEIEKYLSTGIIHGIGPVTAKKIVKAFGKDTLHILDNNIERLKEIEGIGEKKFNIIYESYIETKDLKDIMIFFQKHGITVNQCLKIYKKFGADSINKVSINPYILNDEISGIGFLTADKIAKEFGVEDTSSFRIQSGIRYVLNNFSAMGNTYMPKDKLIQECQKVLAVSKEIIEENIYNCVLEEKLKIEKIKDIEAVYSLPYYYCELGVTNKIITLCIENFQTINTDVEFEVSTFEKKNNIKFAPSQKKAILGAFENGIEIITGGPGTGKTTIIKCIIEIYENSGMKVLLAAPTGRAAKRMSESTEREAKTIHRLLEMGVSDEENSFFCKGESEPLEADVIIIDEASMIDIMLMNSLLKAIKLGTRVIIVGDVDQLPSVGPGNVLRDIIRSGCFSVVELKKIFRQASESDIVVNAHKINRGEQVTINNKSRDFFFLKRYDADIIIRVVIALIQEKLPRYVDAKPYEIQVLTPMRKGLLGVERLNQILQRYLNPPDEKKKEKEIGQRLFREGDKVMQVKNNYQLEWEILGRYKIPVDKGVGVFNGDTGIMTEINEFAETATVEFEDGRQAQYSFKQLEELELAYAVTIHKSQGSEYPAVILPILSGPRMLMNRNLLYTAVTRARKCVTVVGSENTFAEMIRNEKQQQRYSSLDRRIRELDEAEIN